MYEHPPLTVLVVIESRVHLQSFLATLGRASERAAPICVAHPDEAAPYLDGRAPELMVADLARPQTATALRERYPDTALILVGERVDLPQVEVAVRSAATALLRLPCEAPALRQLLASPPAARELRGSCRGVSTASLLALHCSAGADGVLYLVRASDGASGCVHLEGGQPIHAAVGPATGADAVRELLSWHDAGVRWIAGHSGAARTIVGRWETALGDPRPAQAEDLLPLAVPEVIEKLARLAQTPDILGAFLLRHAEVVTGRCVPELDARITGRALCRLSHTHADVEGLPSEEAGREIQATLGTVRLVVDRLGPAALGYQVGVVVRQASPVCKSLRRLLRQIDRSFERSLARGANGPGGRLAVA